MDHMKRVNLTRRSKMLHVEAPGCIVNIRPGLTDSAGRHVVNIEILADSYPDDRWLIDGDETRQAQSIRVIRTRKPEAA